MSFDKKKMGAKIAALRKDRKLTQEQLAEKIGVTVQYLGTIERGKANTTLNRLDKIADVLGCESDDLIYTTTHLDTAAASIINDDPEIDEILQEIQEFNYRIISKIQYIKKS